MSPAEKRRRALRKVVRDKPWLGVRDLAEAMRASGFRVSHNAIHRDLAAIGARHVCRWTFDPPMEASKA